MICFQYEQKLYNQFKKSSSHAYFASHKSTLYLIITLMLSPKQCLYFYFHIILLMS